MNLVSEHGDKNHRKMEDEATEQAEENEEEKETEKQQQEVKKDSNDEESPPKPEGYVPTDNPPTIPYPETNATITDLAKQELGNWMSGGPNASEGGEEQEDKSSQNEGDNNAEGNYADPSEMDIAVPETEEEEEEIDEEIEEWEEDHGKAKPDGKDEDGGGMDIPQTEEEEEKVNEEVEEREENNGKPNPGDDVAEESTSDEEEELIETETEKPIEDTKAIESTPAVNPLIVTSPSWTPPDIKPKHTLAPRSPTVAPVPAMPSPTALATPTGNTVVAKQQEDLACQEYGSQTASYLLCKNNIPPMAGFAVGLGVPLFIVLCCCWKYCCGRSKKDTNNRGEYRQIANTYGDASFDNAFSEDISDDEEDLEDASWGESNGRRVLEMRNMGRRKGDDDLSLEEMNG